MENIVTYGHIEIMPYEFVRLHELKILKTVNDHGRKKWSRELTDHELDESKRMQNNEVYRTIESWDPVEGMTGNPPGAHDNAPKPPGSYPGFNPKF